MDYKHYAVLDLKTHPDPEKALGAWIADYVMEHFPADPHYDTINDEVLVTLCFKYLEDDDIDVETIVFAPDIEIIQDSADVSVVYKCTSDTSFIPADLPGFCTLSRIYVCGIEPAAKVFTQPLDIDCNIII
jgi:hypothetical protein